MYVNGKFKLSIFVSVLPFLILYNRYNLKIPIYGITFGDAEEKQLSSIATLTNAKVFNGKSGFGIGDVRLVSNLEGAYPSDYLYRKLTFQCLDLNWSLCEDEDE